MKNNKINQIQEEATFWIACQKEGLSTSQAKKLELWLNTSPIHLSTFNKAKRTYDLFKNLSNNNANKLSSNANKGAKRTKIFEKIKPFAMAAIFLLAISISIFKINDYSKISFTQSYISKNEKMKNITLPDGSKIQLDAKTNLDIIFYKNTREVKLLSGRVMFYIAADKNRPFIIESNNVFIEVVGTKFEVNKTNKDTTINVEEGLVKSYYLNHNDIKKHVILLKKENSITYSNTGEIINYDKIKTQNIAQWRNDFINFNQVPLKDVIKQFSKYSNLSISFSSKEIEDYTITGEFVYNQIDIFLKNIIKIYPLTIIKNGNLVQISKKN